MRLVFCKVLCYNVVPEVRGSSSALINLSLRLRRDVRKLGWSPWKHLPASIACPRRLFTTFILWGRRSEEMNYICWSFWALLGLSGVIDLDFGSSHRWHISSTSPAANWPVQGPVSVIGVVIGVVVVVVAAGSV
jgi:hypothetical protein